MALELPIPEAADLTTRAAAEGLSTQEFLGIQALAGAYGHSHPAVSAFRNRAKTGVNGPKTHGGGK